MGKGGRCPVTRTGRYARCEAPKPSWGSSALRRTLESWVLQKAHVRFGEGRMEKCPRSNSPAAYSTGVTRRIRIGSAAERGPEPRVKSAPPQTRSRVTGSRSESDADLEGSLYAPAKQVL